jgi:hypothetical protein
MTLIATTAMRPGTSRTHICGGGRFFSAPTFDSPRHAVPEEAAEIELEAFVVSASGSTPAARSRPLGSPRPVQGERSASSIVLAERDAER